MSYDIAETQIGGLYWAGSHDTLPAAAVKQPIRMALSGLPGWAGLLNSSLIHEHNNRSLFLQDGPCWGSFGVTLALVLCYILVFMFGFIGNILLICIIARQRDQRNVTSIFIANLSISDILICVFCLPFTLASTLMDHWVFGAVLCRLTPFVQCMSVTASVLSLVLIALERHQLVLHPSGWKPSPAQARCALLGIWLLAAFTSLPFLVFQLLTSEPYSDLPPPHSQLQACQEVWPSAGHRRAYSTTMLLFQYCGPLLLMVLCYVRIFLRLRWRMLERKNSQRRTDEHKRLTHSKHISAMLLTLVMAFAVCWMPLNVYNMVADWHEEGLPICQHDLLFLLCHVLAMSSTCVNPIIYGFLNFNFRSEVCSMFQLCCCHEVEGNYENFPLSIINTDRLHISLKLSGRNHSISNRAKVTQYRNTTNYSSTLTTTQTSFT
ncbi:neuropeptide Y receptor type 4 [Electrophorus electricus]|uniref:neuropeptide Y receptor type 4 n=1 Tax=Electrophorus electricus TaxID=8005 RepID=UPI0015D025F4|nr:neuropeptide Y receptor type 4 [Electrophorus electricus]